MKAPGCGRSYTHPAVHHFSSSKILHLMVRSAQVTIFRADTLILASSWALVCCIGDKVLAVARLPELGTPSPLENRQRRSGQPAVWRGARWPSLFSRAQALRPFRGVPEAYKISDTTASQLAKSIVLALRRFFALIY